VPTPTAPDTVKPNPATTDESPSDAPDANLVRVDVHLPVQPGLQFHLQSVDWTGNHTIPTDALQKFVTVAPGAIADLPRLRESLDELTKTYRSRGYMAVQHAVVPHLDTTAETASFTVKIVEGDIYHFGELTIEGVDAKTAARLRERWALRAGEPFDANYEMTFMKETQNLLPQGRWSSADTHLDESDKTVDVVLRYSATSIY
jgi:outer membrane protein assembly factor BamA